MNKDKRTLVTENNMNIEMKEFDNYELYLLGDLDLTELEMTSLLLSNTFDDLIFYSFETISEREMLEWDLEEKVMQFE
jgi:hypothetical protein